MPRMMQNQTRGIVLLALLTAAAVSACSDFATAPTRTPAELRVTPDTAVLMTGETTEFTLELLDSNGQVYDVIPAWAPPLWTSDRENAVVVDGNVVTAQEGGESLLQVELAGVLAEAVLRANPTELGVDVAMVYINQGSQRTSGNVPLVAGRRGLLRVYVEADEANFYRPAVRATILQGGETVHEVVLELENHGLPTHLSEGALALSYDAEVPGTFVQPGAQLVIQIDPDGSIPALSGGQLRIPAEGALDLDVQEVPPFRLMMVPVTLASNGGRTSRLDDEHAGLMTQLTADIFPLGAVEVEVREPYVTEARMDTENGWYELISEIRFLRQDDGNPHYYYGGFRRPSGTGIAGLGYIGFPVAIGTDGAPDVIAHELGHTFNLPHAPCGGPLNPDPNFPHPGGGIGAYGYSAAQGALQRPDKYDLMTYCDPIWISDYNYERVLAYRDTSEYDAGFEAAAAAGLQEQNEPTMILQGGVFRGELRLEPALEWTGPVSLPDQGGAYTLEGLNAAGAVLFSVALEPTPLDHGGSHFMVALPESMARPDEIDRLRLRGPEGMVERGRAAGAGPRPAGPPDVRIERRLAASGGGASHAARWDAARYPLAVVRDRETGRIRAIARDGSIALPDADATRYEVILSDGVSSRAARVVER